MKKQIKTVAVALTVVMSMAAAPFAVFAGGDITYEQTVVSNTAVSWVNLNEKCNVGWDAGTIDWNGDGLNEAPDKAPSGKAVEAKTWGRLSVQDPSKNYWDSVAGAKYAPLYAMGAQAIWSSEYSQNILNGDVVAFTSNFDIQGRCVNAVDLSFTSDNAAIVTVNGRYLASTTNSIRWENYLASGGVEPEIGAPMGDAEVAAILNQGIMINTNIKDAYNDNNLGWNAVQTVHLSDIDNWLEVFHLSPRSTNNVLKVYGINAGTDCSNASNGGNPAFVMYGLTVKSSDHGVDVIPNWMAIHLDVVGTDTTNTVTMAGGTQYQSGQGWGFTYFNLADLSQGKDLTLNIVGGKKLTTYGKATLSLVEVNGQAAIKVVLTGITLAAGNEVFKAQVSDNESLFTGKNYNQGNFAFKAPAPQKVNGSYTFTIPLNIF